MGEQTWNLGDEVPDKVHLTFCGRKAIEKANSDSKKKVIERKEMKREKEKLDVCIDEGDR